MNRSTIRQRLGWALVLDRQPGEGRVGRPDPREMVRWFIGTSSRHVVYGAYGPLRWALLVPEQLTAIAAWSVYENDTGFCLIEGEFYDGFQAVRCQGVDGSELAEALLSAFTSRQEDALQSLNGVFSGAIYEHQTGRFFFFVDRTGVRSTFYHCDEQRLVVSTNLGGFRALRDEALRLDARACYENLIISHPLEDRTLIKDVRMPPSGHVAVFDGRKVEYRRYWRWLERIRSEPLARSAGRLIDAIDAHFMRVGPRMRGGGGVGLGLSGGRDSRVLFSSLCRSAIPFEAMTYSLGVKDADLELAERLCDAIGVRRRAVHFEQQAELNVAAMPDGAAEGLGESAGWGSIRFAVAAAPLYDVLVTGQDGDPLSGSYAAFQPWAFHNVDQLAQASQDAVSGPFDEGAVRRLFQLDFGADAADAAREAWRGMFDESWNESLANVFLDQRLRATNRRRYVARLRQLDLTSQAMFPYMDREVQDAYLSMPVLHMKDTRAHSLAAYLRTPLLGAIPLAGRPIPLRYEWRLGPVLRRFKTWRDRRVSRRAPKRSSQPYPLLALLGAWAQNTRSLNPAGIAELLSTLQRPLPRDTRLANKLIAHCVFERVYINREVSTLPPFSLLDVHPRDVDATKSGGDAVRQHVPGAG